MQPLPEVLIVDDDPVTREMLALTLADDFTVRAASDGTQALEELAERPPVAMLLDVHMPGVDGYDVLEVRRDRGLAPDTRVIILSAEDDERALVRCWSLGADSYLTKPIDPVQIVAKVRAVLDLASGLRAPSSA